VFWQDPAAATSTNHAAFTAGGSAPEAQWRRSSATSSRLDRDPCSPFGQRSHFRPGAGTVAKEQTAFAAPHHQADTASRSPGLPRVRLRAVPNNSGNDEKKALLLQLTLL